MSLTMTEGTLVRWLKNEHDTIAKGEPVAEIETDKVVQEMESPASGVLTAMVAPSASPLPVGTVLAWITERGEELEADEKAIVGKPASDQLLPHLHQEDNQAVGPTETGALQPKVAPSQPTTKPKASPAAKKRAAELDVDLGQVEGTGPGGRVTREDVERYVGIKPPAESTATSAQASPADCRLAEEAGLNLADITGSGAGGRIVHVDVEQIVAAAATPTLSQEPKVLEAMPMQGMRRVTAERMVTSAHTTAPVTLNCEADASDLVRWREHINAARAKVDHVPVSYNDLLILIVARALREHVDVNIRLRDNTIERLGDINIGLAIDTDQGLLVPVVKNADRLSLDQIAETTRQLVELAHSRRLGIDHMSEGTFTISNLGMFEIDHFSPIINLPEIAILGVGHIAERPVGYKGQIMLRHTVALSLTFDHRLIDGAPAARFLQTIKRYVEHPVLPLPTSCDDGRST